MDAISGSKGFISCLGRWTIVTEAYGTLAGPMIPWHGYGVYMAGTLGVAWSAFFPYLFLLYLTPVFSIFYGFTGISIKHLPETKNNESKEEK